MINKVILIGNLGADPEVRVLDSGTKVAKIRVATNENYRDRNTNEWQTITEWHNVILWRHLADNAERMLKKGSLVYIEGKLSTRRYQDKDGVEKYFTEVVANTMRTLERRESSGSGGYFPSDENDPFAQKPTSSPAAPESPVDSSSEEDEDDLPF